MRIQEYNIFLHVSEKSHDNHMRTEYSLYAWRSDFYEHRNVFRKQKTVYTENRGKDESPRVPYIETNLSAYLLIIWKAFFNNEEPMWVSLFYAFNVGENLKILIFGHLTFFHSALTTAFLGLIFTNCQTWPFLWIIKS